MKKYKFLKNHLIYEFLNSNMSLDLEPIIIGYERCPSNKKEITFKKMHYVFTYVFKGKGTFSIGGKNYSVVKNSLLLFPPEKVTYAPDKDDPWDYMRLAFTGSKVGELLNKSALSSQNPIFKPKNPEKFFELFADLLEDCVIEEQRNNFQYACAASLMQMFFYIITQQSESIMTETGEKANINSIVQYIDANFSDPELSLKKISDEFFFSPPYLSRIFKKAMNISPSKYIIQLRINKAKRMLQINQFKIANIAYACGYTSPYYFSLEFKRIVGMSPSKYKQKSFHIE